MRLAADLVDMSLFSSTTEDRLLHEQELPVQVSYPNRDREDRTATLMVRVKTRTDSGQKTSTFLVEIVDEQDPLFLYTISVSEPEFPELKKDQNLLIDFSQLHVHVIDIVKRVRDQSLRYAARLVLSANQQDFAEFAVYETNDFRRTDQIKFKALQATDNILKKHLSLNIKALKTRCSTLQSECNEYQCSSRKRESELFSLQKEYESSLKHFETQRNSMTLDFSEKLSLAKEEAARQQRKTEIQFDEDKRSLESDYRRQLANLTSKLESAQMHNQELSQTNLNLNHSVESLQSKLTALTQELDHSSAEQNRLKSVKESLDSQMLSLEKEIGRLTSRVAFLEQQLTDKESLCQKVQSLLDASNEQKTHLEHSMTMFKDAAQKDERRLSECIKEIKKGNQIIQTLQNELKSAKSKLKLKGTVVVQQEAVLEKTKQEVETLNRNLSEHRSDIKRLQSELLTKDTEIRQLNKELDESKETHSRHQGIINMLNNQLQENQASKIPALNRQFRPRIMPPTTPFHKSFDGVSSPLSYTPPSKLDYNSNSATAPGRAIPYQANSSANSAFFPHAPSAPTTR